MNTKFSEWLFNELRKRDMSQADLARASGITRGGVSNLLNQVRRPDPGTCTAIAKAFNLPPETVFRAAGLLPSAPPDQPPTLLQWINLYLEADDDTREDLLNYAIYRAQLQKNKKKTTRNYTT